MAQARCCFHAPRGHRALGKPPVGAYARGHGKQGAARAHQGNPDQHRGRRVRRRRARSQGQTARGTYRALAPKAGQKAGVRSQSRGPIGFNGELLTVTRAPRSCTASFTAMRRSGVRLQDAVTACWSRAPTEGGPVRTLEPRRAAGDTARQTRHARLSRDDRRGAHAPVGSRRQSATEQAADQHPSRGKGRCCTVEPAAADVARVRAGLPCG